MGFQPHPKIQKKLMIQFQENIPTEGRMEGQTDPILQDPSGYCWESNKDMTVLEKMHNVLLKDMRERLPPLRGIERHGLLEATGKLDEVMNKTEFGNIREMNDLVYAGAVVVTEMLGVKNRKST